MFDKIDFAQLNSLLQNLIRYQAFSEHESEGFSQIVSSSNWIYPKNLNKSYSAINFGLRKSENLVNKSLYMNNFLILKIVSNGILVFDTYDKCVWKGQSCEFEPNFILNHLNSNLYFPDMSIKIVDVKYDLEGFNFIKLPFLDNLFKKSKLLWYFYATRLKKDIYAKSDAYLDLKSISNVREDISNCKAIFERNPVYLQPHKDLLLNFSDSLVQFLKDIPRTKQFDVAFKFSHGDLMQSNFIKTKQSIILTDWDNGGIHSYFYDLLIMHIYQKHSVFWKIVFSNTIPKPFVYIYTLILFNFAIKSLSARSENKLTLEQFKTYVVIAIYEFYSKNYLRYNHENGATEGEFVLGSIRELVMRSISFLDKGK